MRRCPEADQVLNREVDAPGDVEIDEAQPVVVVPVPDHHQWVTVFPQELGSGVVGEDFVEDHPIGLTTSEDRQELAVRQSPGDDVDRVAGFFDPEGGRHDQAQVGRVELLRDVHGDEARPAGSDLLPGALGRETTLLHHPQDASARRLGHVRLAIENPRHRRDRDAAGGGDIDDRRR